MARSIGSPPVKRLRFPRKCNPVTSLQGLVLAPLSLSEGRKVLERANASPLLSLPRLALPCPAPLSCFCLQQLSAQSKYHCTTHSHSHSTAPVCGQASQQEQTLQASGPPHSRCVPQLVPLPAVVHHLITKQPEAQHTRSNPVHFRSSFRHRLFLCSRFLLLSQDHLNGRKPAFPSPTLLSPYPNPNSNPLSLLPALTAQCTPSLSALHMRYR